MKKRILSLLICLIMLAPSLINAFADDDFPYAGSSLTGEEALITAAPGSINSLTGWKDTESYQALESELGSENVSALLEEGYRDDIAESVAQVLEMFGTNKTVYDTTDLSEGHGPISFTSVTEIPPEYLLLIETLIQNYYNEELSILSQWDAIRTALMVQAERLDEEMQEHYEQLMTELLERLKTVREMQKALKEIMNGIVNSRQTPFTPYTLADVDAILSKQQPEDPGPQCVVEILYEVRDWTTYYNHSGSNAPATPSAQGGPAATPSNDKPKWVSRRQVSTYTYGQVSGFHSVPIIVSDENLPKGFGYPFSAVGGRYVGHSVYTKSGRTPNSLDDYIMTTIESFGGTNRYLDVNITAVNIIYKNDANVTPDSYYMNMYTQTHTPPSSESGSWKEVAYVRVIKAKQYYDYFKDFEKEMADTIAIANELLETLKQIVGWDGYLPAYGLESPVPNLWVDDEEAIDSMHEYIAGLRDDFTSSKDEAVAKYRAFASGNSGRSLLSQVVLKGVSGMTAEELVTKLVEKYPRQYLALQKWFKELEKELENMQGFTDDNGVTYDAATAKQFMAISQLLFFASFRDTISVYEIVEANVTDVSSFVIMSQTPTSFSASTNMYNWGILSPSNGRTWQNVKRTQAPQLKYRFYTPGTYYVVCTQNIMYEVVTAVTVSFRGSLCVKGTDGNLKVLYTWEKAGHLNTTNDGKDDPGARDTDRCVAYYNVNFWTSEERGEVDDITGTVGKVVWQGSWTVTGEENLLSGLNQEYTTKRVE